MLGGVQVRSRFVNHSFAIAEDDILCPKAQEEPGDGHPRCSRPAHCHLQIRKVFSHQAEGIDQGGQGDHCRAMLIIMKYRDLQGLLQPLLHLKAAGSADILQVYPSEDRLDHGHGPHYILWILRGDSYRKGIYSREVLEQYRFALHNRNGGQSPDVAQTQHGSAVCYHCHQISLGGVAVDIIWIHLDLATGCGHPWGIGQAQIPAGGAGHLAVHGNLSPDGFMKG